MMDRRAVLISAAAMAASGSVALARSGARATRAFPSGFLWGAATSGHQTEGNNVASDSWLLETVKPSAYAERSGDAVNSFALWPQDLDLVKSIGLNSFRFSLEWSRIEPEQGQFSVAMLDHYKAIIEGCRSRHLTPVVTFNHFTNPRWFAAAGGWTNREAPELFARFCERAAKHLAAEIGYAVTLNEPNLPALLRYSRIPEEVFAAQKSNRAAAARAMGSDQFWGGFLFSAEEFAPMIPNLLAAHRRGRDAIKSVRAELPVGMSLAISDDQSFSGDSQRDAKRAAAYGPWLELARSDDFIGVQNYDRSRIGPKGQLPPPTGVALNSMGSEIYAPSLEGAVRYAHQTTGRPVLITEHGLGSDNDQLRAAFIPDALRGLKRAIGDGVPVLGYIHWSLIDNFEWYFGYRPHFGLVAVDRATFKRSPKPSATVLGTIARDNGNAL
jgi:beta-glucosidase